MDILNGLHEDLHTHSVTFSDGWNTVDELVKYAGEFGLTKLAITDHSKALTDHCGITKETFRGIKNNWGNVHNNVKVIFGVEADLIDKEGNICDRISSSKEEDFIILSYHPLFEATSSEMKDSMIKAIQKNYKKINMIGHPCAYYDLEDSEAIIYEANKYGVPLELNGKYFLKDPEPWRLVLEKADRIYINSDAHTLIELRDIKKETYDKLKYIHKEIINHKH